MSLIATWRRPGMAVAALAAVLGCAGALRAQTPSGDLLRNNPKIVQLFRPVVAAASASTVRILCDGKEAGLGTVVGADGWIITKASELHGKVVCRFKDGKEYLAKIAGVQEPYDLALVQIDAHHLKPVQWEDSQAVKVGRWVASAAPAEDPVAIGVISVGTRSFKNGDQPPKNLATNGGYLGVGLDNAPNGAKITQVAPKSPAARAGLKANDIITYVGAKKVLGMESMMNLIQKHKPGDEVILKARRGDEEMEFKARLAKRPANLMGNPQERMGSALSNRRGGFPSILQHDTVIKPSDCGGPLVDLDGKVVGINIARAGRTETYAVPSAVVRDLLPQLMSGKLAPSADESDDAPRLRPGSEREPRPR